LSQSEEGKQSQEFWNKGISFYHNGIGFEYKNNPLDQARAPKLGNGDKRERDLTYIGLQREGRQEEANFMVAISHTKGVIMKKQYSGAITGGKFARIIRTEFDAAFAAS